MRRKTILLSGADSSFGRALIGAALSFGCNVVGVTCTEDGGLTCEALSPEPVSGRLLDLRATNSAESLVAAVESGVGVVDVLINNPSVTYRGMIEESPLEALEDQLRGNLIAPVAMTKAVLPYMRHRRSGQIANVTTLGGLVAFPGYGFYSASKFALEGLSEALRKEVKNLGITVTAIGLGHCGEPAWTEPIESGRSHIEDYAVALRAAQEARTFIPAGQRAADATMAAQAAIDVLMSGAAPAHLLLGADAVQWLREKIGALTAEITAWESVSLSVRAH
ncbi:SDR family NAD(P)-dependent oxidoreductase [Burkholderia multivorans]|uniref:Short-chain dehydrogenase/reductase SDR n=1 Tax=Burkholderia multivorans CGD2 TaxID=513052 RepID=B9BNS8_9BURK|nr:SDR family NAD(P)-dependent oxidoreductase [Burkholderia multivorans]EEE07246.1 short-chain dehydrogenase/reductase SDR [Burkholderia multivorans CGD2]EEE13616.1 short-chain dehydrogenase/reductase SDR [Burkholderia multivorans CGD2M]